MKKEETFQILEEYLKGIPVYNTHSHHLPAEQLTDVGLDYLLAHSYLNEEWEDCGVPGKEDFYRRFRDRSFHFDYVALRQIYSSFACIVFLSALRSSASNTFVPSVSLSRMPYKTVS